MNSMLNNVNSAKINVVIVHGIGINTQGYADPLIKGISAQFNKELRGILKASDDYTDQLNFIPVIWDDIVALQEAKLDDIFRENFKKRRKRNVLGILGRFLISLSAAGTLYFLFNKSFVFIVLFFPVVYYAPIAIYWLRTSFAARFVCDITSYNEKGAKILILQRIKDRVTPLTKLQGTVNLSFISHSLGTVIASDFVWDEEKAGGFLTQKIFLSNFFTMGSPLPLFSLQFGGPDVFNKPISIQDSQGRWVNIYDKADPIAYPLKPLNEAYNRAVLKDHEVNGGMFGVAHLKYWTHKKVHMTIAGKLALDWLRFNGKLDKTQLDALYADYDKHAASPSLSINF